MNEFFGNIYIALNGFCSNINNFFKNEFSDKFSIVWN